MKTTVSVIIPTYNRRHLLLAAIESATSQRGPVAEVIVVDDGSSDSTRDLVRSFGAPIRYIYQDHSGPATARNRGLELARGKYVIFLDSDDLIMKDKSALQSMILDNNPGVTAVYSRWKLSTLDDHLIKEDGEDLTQILLPTLLCTNIAPLNSFLFRRDDLISVGGFDEACSPCEDWDLLLRLAMIGSSFAFIPEVTAVYRIHEASSSANPQMVLEKGLDVLTRAFSNPLLPARFIPYRSLAQQMHYITVAWQRLLASDQAGSQSCLSRMVTAFPVDSNQYLMQSIRQLAPRYACTKEEAFYQIVTEMEADELCDLLEMLRARFHQLTD